MHQHDGHNTHNHEAHHQHHHLPSNTFILFIVLCITLSFASIEGIVGYLIKSATIKTDAVHALTDALGIAIASYASFMTKKRATKTLSYGYGKAETLGALINCIFSVILTGFLLVESVERLFDPVAIAGADVLLIAGVSLVVNVIILRLLAGHGTSLNVKSVIIHTIGDVLGSLLAIVSGFIIYWSHWYLIDPILSLVIICWLIWSNYSIMVRSMHILLSGVPVHLNYQEIKHSLEQIPGVNGIHDLHIWHISTNNTSLTAHITCIDDTQWLTILQLCKTLLHTKYNIQHITLQHENAQLDCANHACTQT